jgi:dynein intermediate chain 2
MQPNEKANMAALLDREASREKVLVSRMRELALKERAKSAKKPQGGEGGEKEGEGAAAGDDEEEDPIAAAESNFWEVIQGNAAKSKKAAKSVEGEEGAAAEGNPAAEPAAE